MFSPLFLSVCVSVCVCVCVQAEMALLMDDDEDEKHKHFNFDKIVEEQNLSKKKRKKLLKSNTPLEEDNFQVSDRASFQIVTSTEASCSLNLICILYKYGDCRTSVN